MYVEKWILYWEIMLSINQCCQNTCEKIRDHPIFFLSHQTNPHHHLTIDLAVFFFHCFHHSKNVFVINCNVIILCFLLLPGFWNRIRDDAGTSAEWYYIRCRMPSTRLLSTQITGMQITGVLSMYQPIQDVAMLRTPPKSSISSATIGIWTRATPPSCSGLSDLGRCVFGDQKIKKDGLSLYCVLLPTACLPQSYQP